MEIYEYTLIAMSPVMLFMIIWIIVIIIIYCRNGQLSDLEDFVVLNGFPAILKTTIKDEVYMRKGKVQLQGKTLEDVKKALFWIFMSLLIFVFLGFGQLAFIEYSHNCEEMDQGSDCFEYPDTTVRANCSDPDILQGKKHVLCYRLVFQFELAIGVSYGMYTMSTVLLSIVATLIIKMNQSHVRRFKLVVFSIIFIIDIILVRAIVLRSRPLVLSLSTANIKLIFYVVSGFFTSYFFIVKMPWEEIIADSTNSSNGQREAAERGAYMGTKGSVSLTEPLVPRVDEETPLIEKLQKHDQ